MEQLSEVQGGNIRRDLIVLWNVLSDTRRNSIKRLVWFSLLAAALEALVLASIVPVFSPLMEPETVSEIGIVSELMAAVGLTAPWQAVVFLLCVFLLLLVTASAVKLLLLWFSARVAYMASHELCVSLFSSSISRPYSYHVDHNSSDHVTALQILDGVVAPLLHMLVQLVSSFVIGTAVVVTLLVIDFRIALICAMLLALGYIAVSRSVKGRLSQIGVDRVTAARARIRQYQEALGGVRDILLGSYQAEFTQQFVQAERRLRRAQVQNVVIGGVPSVVMELLVMVVMLTMVAYFIIAEGGIGAAIPTLAAMAWGARRLMPSFAQVYKAWSTALSSAASLSHIAYYFNLEHGSVDVRRKGGESKCYFADQIRLIGISFTYGGGRQPTICGVNMGIGKGEIIGLVGKSGSGKSTLLDLLMGLIPPSSGQILVDGVCLTKVSQDWRDQVMHVPQSIYLADKTIAENIALGIPEGQIDRNMVYYAAKMANIHKYIENLPSQYETIVGEHGVKLSGGQRQRLGIARALYKGGSILILDEATSALDEATETEVFKELVGLAPAVTIVLVTHRMVTLKHCDCVYELFDGNLAKVA